MIVKDTLEVKDNDSLPFRRAQFRIPGFCVTADFLIHNPNIFFIFGDNTIHRGYGGAARLRDFPNAIGFITKKYPNNNKDSFYTVDEYLQVFIKEQEKFYKLMTDFPNHYYLFSKIGSGLANKYCIFESILEPWLLSLENQFNNCSLLF